MTIASPPLPLRQSNDRSAPLLASDGAILPTPQLSPLAFHHCFHTQPAFPAPPHAFVPYSVHFSDHRPAVQTDPHNIFSAQFASPLLANQQGPDHPNSDLIQIKYPLYNFDLMNSSSSSNLFFNEMLAGSSFVDFNQPFMPSHEMHRFSAQFRANSVPDLTFSTATSPLPFASTFSQSPSESEHAPITYLAPFPPPTHTFAPIIPSTPPTSPLTTYTNVGTTATAVAPTCSKPARFKPGEEDLALLMGVFNRNPYPNAVIRKRLAAKLGLELRQIQFCQMDTNTKPLDGLMTDDALSLALLLDRRFSLPLPQYFASSGHQSFDLLSDSTSSSLTDFQKSLQSSGANSFSQHSQDSNGSLIFPLNVQQGQFGGQMGAFAFNQGEGVSYTSSPRDYSPVDILTSMGNQMDEIDVLQAELNSYQYMFPPSHQQQEQQQSFNVPDTFQNANSEFLQHQKNQDPNFSQFPPTFSDRLPLHFDGTNMNQFQTPVASPKTNGFRPSIDPDLFNSHGFLQPSHTMLSSPFDPSFLPQPSHPTTPSLTSITPSTTNNTPSLGFLPTTKPLPKPSSLVPANLFRTAPEPGLDLLLASPIMSPPNLLAARRNSLLKDFNAGGEGGGENATKMARFRPTEAEAVLLTQIFQRNPFPSAGLRRKLAERMCLDVKQVQFWFQNRRATMKVQGIHVLKPKRGLGLACGGTGGGGRGKARLGEPTADMKRRASLTQLSSDSEFFYVDRTKGVAPVKKGAV
ncbi:hypothetical protein HDU98_009653 [Podochytrium sp. JEL0797]|nr:hypothetical protein HDU98_009653 [Podochytrium sp. JEL0797]